MEKSIATKDYRLFLRRLRDARRIAGMTQVELASRLGEPQSFISKYERGERRLDLLEVRAICDAMGVSFVDFVSDLDQAIGRRTKRKRKDDEAP